MPGLCETEREKAAARAFAEGKRLFDARKYIDAIATFKEAYRLRPHFMVQCSIARCHEHLSNVIQAAEHYRRCLQEGADKTDMVGRLRSSLQEVEARITWVEVSSPGAGGTIFVDGNPAGPAPKRVAINPGKHVLEVRRDGARPARQSISTLGGEKLSLALTPMPIEVSKVQEVGEAQRAERTPTLKQEQEPSRRRLSQVWFWSATGATAALAVVSIVLGVQTLGARSDYESDPTEGGYNSFVEKRLATNICWALTAAAAGGTTVLFFYTDFGGRQDEDDQGKRSSSFGVGLQGTF
jgi:hypothetical protein